MIFLCVERHLFGKELEKMQDHVKLTDDSLLLISEDFSPVFGMKMNRHVTHTQSCLRIREFCSDMGWVRFFFRGGVADDFS